MIKRFAAALLALSLLCALPALALAVSSYGVDQTTTGYGSLNIYSKPQCTWHCWGRTYERYGVRLPNMGNAKNWYANALSMGYVVGSTARVGAIAVFKDVGSATSGYGHVAIVEKVSGNMAYISEGNYGGLAYHEDSYNCATGTRFAGTTSEQQIIGYIYPYNSLDGVDVTVAFSPYAKQSIGQNDATLARTISVSGVSINSVSKVGIILYDSVGNTLGSKFETPTPKDGVINAWYDVKDELGVTLSASTTYRYTFQAVVNGTTYSESDTFTTDSDGVYVAFNPNTKQNIGSTDATLAKTISVSGADISKVTKVGIRLYNASGATLLGSKSETPTPKDGVINAWYGLKDELGVTLSPSTAYTYRFYVILGGVTYNSPLYAFTSASTGVRVTFGASSRESVSQTNATLAKTISVSGADISKVTKVGIKLYTWRGTLLGSKSETPTPKDGVINAWYDVNSELGVTLNPGYEYHYAFFAVVNGVTYTSQTYVFSALPIYVTGVTLEKTSLTLDLLENPHALLYANTTPSNATFYSVSWSSSNTAVATVVNGGITAHSVGSCVITATTTDGSNLSAQCKVTVKATLNLLEVYNASVRAKTHHPLRWGIDAYGGSGSVHYEYEIYRDGSVVHSGQTSDPEFSYTPTETGVYFARVTAVDVYNGGASTLRTASVDSEPLTVTPGPSGVELSHDALTLSRFGAGSRFRLSARCTPEDAPADPILWRSSDPAVATVSSGGIVTAQRAGSAQITAHTQYGLSASLTVVVAEELGTLDLPAQARVLGEQAFYGSAAQRVVLPDGLTRIPDEAFRGMEALLYAQIPASVTEIGSDAFEDCPNLYILCQPGSFAQQYAVDQGIAHFTPDDLASGVPVEGVRLSLSADSVVVGGSAQASAAITPEGATDKRVLYAVDDPFIAAVDGDGRITTRRTGKAVVTATTVDGSFTASAALSVVAPASPNALSLSLSSVTLHKGQTRALSAIPYPADHPVTWSTSNAAVAAYSNGSIRAVGQGSARLTASLNDAAGTTATCDVTVLAPLASSVSLSKTSLSLKPGESAALTASISPADAAQGVTWSSSNTGVASVSGGTVTAKAAGTATITARASDGSGKSAACTVTVTAPQQASGVVKHPEIKSGNKWYRLYPTIDHLAFGATTNARRYAAIINQFDVCWGEDEASVYGWYEPKTPLHPSTYCNYFAADVCFAMGAFMPIANTCETCGRPVGSSSVKSHTASGTVYTSGHYLWKGITAAGLKCTCTTTERVIPGGWGTSRTSKWFAQKSAQFGWEAVSAAQAVANANAGYLTIGINTGHTFVVYPRGGSTMYISQAGSNLMSNEKMPYTKSDYKYYTNKGL